MKILQVNCVYKKGSTGKITADIHESLQQAGIESVVCYGRGERISEPGVYKTCGELYAKFNNLLSRVTGIMYGGCWFSTNRLISIIQKEHPDVVHLQCINGYFVNIYRLIEWLKEHHIKTVLTLHAEFMYTANCGHALDCEKWKTGCGKCLRRKQETKSWFLDGTARSWKRMKQAFEGFEELQVVAVSDWIAQRASLSPIFRGREILRIHNGINLTKFHKDPGKKEQTCLAETYHLPADKKIVLHVTPGFSNPVKGGVYFRQISEQLPAEYQPVVVGCAEKISERVINIPFVSNQDELAALYRAADVFVITSRADNYPTVCIEANCCGTPVVGFDVGGVKETIGEGMGEVVPAFDVTQMLEKVIYWCREKSSMQDELVKKRKAYCDKSRMTQDYVRLYKQM